MCKNRWIMSAEKCKLRNNQKEILEIKKYGNRNKECVWWTDE